LETGGSGIDTGETSRVVIWELCTERLITVEKSCSDKLRHDVKVFDESVLMTSAEKGLREYSLNHPRGRVAF